MPISTAGNGGIGQAQEVLKELQKQTQQQPKPAEKSFDSVLQKVADDSGAMHPNAVNNVNAQQQVHQVPNATKTGQIDHLNQAEALKKRAIEGKAVIGVEKPETKAPSLLKSFLSRYSKDSDAMDQLMKTAMKGQNFSPGQLLVLQSATYKLTYELDAMNQLVQQASSAVKTTMQTQV